MVDGQWIQSDGDGDGMDETKPDQTTKLGLMMMGQSSLDEQDLTRQVQSDDDE